MAQVLFAPLSQWLEILKEDFMDLCIIFDKSLPTQRSVPAQSFTEHPASEAAAGFAKIAYAVLVTPEAEYPDLRNIRDNRAFQTIDVQTESGVEIPVLGDYNYITGLFIDVTAERYSYTVSLGKKAVEA